MKNIAFINFDITLFGGVEKVTEILANQLSKYYNVHIISLSKANEKTPYAFNSNVKVSYIFSSKMRIRNLLLKSKKKIKRILKENKIETCILMGSDVGFMVNIFVPLKVKKIFCDHGALINQLDDKTVTFYRKIAYKNSNITVTLTEKSKFDYIKLFNANPEKIISIYNPIDDSQNYKYDYNFNSNSLITVGRLSHEKGFDLLIDVAKELKKINKNWKWDIWGSGEEFANIKNKINENQLNDFVFLKGYSDSAIKLYHHYAMYVLTSYREGLPLVLLEAKINKLPIVSFDINTGPREIITNNINGYLIKAYDTTEMAQKINILLTNKTLRKEFSNNSYIGIEKFELNQIINKWKSVIDCL